ncbi:TetR/AcrR family transcriptional regulator [Pararoseomonas sp. SCSIO 73927]|uniref:TetR/AcrR family transcriptional regulator n=1 Tax=Pararoseomonas sp. SCSIO 73927 TaxID=3114537 RepID=UPI0030D3AA37
MTDTGPGPPAAATRRGRPRADQSGLVEERVLDAATAVFLREGFSRSSFEQIAETARAGKATLYARYPSKQDLFIAVVQRCVARVLARVGGHPDGPTLGERLTTYGIMLANEALTTEVVALMRATIAEAGHFPELARQSHRIGFGDSVQGVARVIAGSEEGIAAALPSATRFVELAITPLQMRALCGADLRELRERAPRDVALVVAMLTAQGVLRAA